ncbi:phosphatidate cytidylyltransferase [Rickettsia endosymbiont of Oedothorax gibbosus]|uniref:phosphatidate cytidylyltransferase n=1 Tax=Rickettsia endosymbiont of Oedothorax gibbosus TaxID=931099 RepID=UPI00202487BE|nr:phosphatidate cytidylyltransferase [Rickettsia endosymbiont of Oedothorax gibbosus]
MITQKGRGLLAAGKKKSNIATRILSALVIGPVFIISIISIKSLFYILMLLIAVGMLYEWYQMTKPSCLYGLFGLIIIPIPIISLVIIATEDKNRWLLLLYFTIIWSVDVFAMIGGKNIGGIKLAPKISPNKTWSGLITGVLASGVAAFLLSLLPGFDLPTYYLLNKRHLIIAAFCLALIAQMSDLFISYFKRKFAIKDSGTIIPGHGGVLDRFDSIILTAPILFFIIKIL